MKLVLVDDDERPYANGGKGFLGRFRARWWADPDLDVVFTTRRHGRRVAGVAHEVRHLTDPDFATNDDHHPWWHLCGSAVPVFSRRHLDAYCIATAEAIIREAFA